MEVLTTEALINAVQNEPCIWDLTMNETEENKDVAWKRIGDSCGLPNGERTVFERVRNVLATYFRLVCDPFTHVTQVCDQVFDQLD